MPIVTKLYQGAGGAAPGGAGGFPGGFPGAGAAGASDGGSNTNAKGPTIEEVD